MERAAFTLLHDMESSWWYRGRAAIIRTMLKRIRSSDMNILDFGAGYGGMQKHLAQFGSVDAFEPDAEALAVAKARQYRAVFSSEAEAFAGQYDLISLFDVVEHIEDDRAFLRKARAALTPNGRLVITVPAFPFLWSSHDISHHHYRRYTRASFKALLESEGYEIEYISYWNCVLFIPAAVMRMLGRSGEGSFSLPNIVDRFLFALIRAESLWMNLLPLPFGISLAALARKKPASK